MKIRKSEILKGVDHIMAVKDERRIAMKEHITIVIRKRGQITLPKSILEKLDLKEGDQLELEVNEQGEIKIIPVIQIPKDQAWFWTKEWQKSEKEAEEDIKAGRVKSFDNVKDAMKWLESDKAEKWADDE
jgi:AbrB family looped-hinge helix DNA binding protein